MPFYLMPVAAGIKAVLQFSILGFDIKFVPQPVSSTCWDVFLRWAKHLIATAPFLALALNCWVLDVRDFRRARAMLPAEERGSWSLAIFIVFTIGISSPNWMSCRLLWDGILRASPGPTLGLTARYLHLGGFPLSPWGAAWLKPLRWLLAVVLLPYRLLEMVVNLAYTSIVCAWTCGLCCPNPFKCCTALWGCCVAELCCMWACCKCTFWTFLALLTLFLWPYARGQVESFLPSIFSALKGVAVVAYYIFLLYWARLVTLIFTQIYALVQVARGSHSQSEVSAWERLAKTLEESGKLFIDKAIAEAAGEPGAAPRAAREAARAEAVPLQHMPLEIVQEATGGTAAPGGEMADQEKGEEEARASGGEAAGLLRDRLQMRSWNSAVLADDGLRQHLIACNAAMLNEDFELEDFEQLRAKQDEMHAGGATRDTFDFQVDTVRQSINAASLAMIAQLSLLLIVRMWMLGGVNYMDNNALVTTAYEETLSERHWYTFAATMWEESTTSLWTTSVRLNALWKVL